MTMKYKDMTWGQMEAVVNKLGGMEGVRKLLSGKLTVKEAEYQLQTFKVLVNYDKTLKEMIQVGEYNRTDDGITSDHFPIKRSGQEEKEITLFRFNRSISSEDVISEMAEAGYRPATIEELLALGAEYKELQKQFPIVALGSVWRNPDGGCDAPYLYWVGVERGLNLRWFERDWGDDYHFGAVRNAS